MAKVWNDESVSELAKSLAALPPMKVKPYYLPHGMDWLEKYLTDIQVKFDGISYEISGIILLAEGHKIQEVTRREALTILMTKFLRLVEELEKKNVLMDKLPEIVIGDVGGAYSAQVTLNLGHLSTGASQTGYEIASPKKYPPLKPNKYLAKEEVYSPDKGWHTKAA